MPDADVSTVITVFRSRLRPDAAAYGYDELAEEMERRARATPGFVGFKSFVAADGERVSIVEFADIDSHIAWRDDPAHLDAQHRGRADFYSEYQISVAEVSRRHGFTAER